MNVKIHTKGIRGSGMILEGEEPDVMYGALLEIDGLLIERVSRIRVLHAPDEFSSVMVRLEPGTVETVTHSAESWSDLRERLP